MAQADCTAATDPMHEVLGERAVRREAAQLGVVQRQRKVDIFVLVWTLVLGFQLGTERTIEGLRQLYQRAAGHMLVRSSFYDRLTRDLARLLRRLAKDALAAQAPGFRMPEGQLAKFTEVLAIDATVLRLHDLLARAFQGCRTNHSIAAAKLHVVMNVFDGSAKRVKLTGERTNDAVPWRRVGQWVRDRLLLFDLGYYRFHLFHVIDANGGYFLTRMKRNANPLIVGVNRRWPGRARDVVGLRLQDALDGLKRSILDVQVKVRFKKRKYRGKQRWATKVFRLVAIRNDETGEYHVYLTNVPPDDLEAEDVGQTYALRWQVEILFKAMKSHGHLDHLPSQKRCIVECLVWASVLATIASQALFRAVRKAVSKERHIPTLRWAALFSRCAAELLQLLAWHERGRRQHFLWQQLVHDAPDPNLSRKQRSFEQVPRMAVA